VVLPGDISPPKNVYRKMFTGYFSSDRILEKENRVILIDCFWKRKVLGEK
jgi:hypothetical protein